VPHGDGGPGARLGHFRRQAVFACICDRGPMGAHDGPALGGRAAAAEAVEAPRSTGWCDPTVLYHPLPIA
jgi:hypothetical protein